MNKTRLEAFSDGVLAIVITIMVLELKTPDTNSWDSIKHVLFLLEAYALSFTMVAIYWLNHHHLMHTVTKVNTRILWSNLHLLFWLSLMPFATRWMGETNFERIPVMVFAILNTLCAFAYTIFQTQIMNTNHLSEAVDRAMKKQAIKGMMSVGAYALSIAFAFVDTRISEVLFVIVAIIWFIPDRNIEKALGE